MRANNSTFELFCSTYVLHSESRGYDRAMTSYSWRCLNIHFSQNVTEPTTLEEPKTKTSQLEYHSEHAVNLPSSIQRHKRMEKSVKSTSLKPTMEFSHLDVM